MIVKFCFCKNCRFLAPLWCSKMLSSSTPGILYLVAEFSDFFVNKILSSYSDKLDLIKFKIIKSISCIYVWISYFHTFISPPGLPQPENRKRPLPEEYDKLYLYYKLATFFENSKIYFAEFSSSENNNVHTVLKRFYETVEFIFNWLLLFYILFKCFGGPLTIPPLFLRSMNANYSQSFLK